MKWIWRTLGLLLLSVVVVFLIDEKLINAAERNSGFKESDRWLYRFYVDKDIKSAPRISDDYYFRFRRLDGASPETSSIIFISEKAINPQPLKDYLGSIGYRHINNDDMFGERWVGKRGPLTTFYIQYDKTGKYISLSKCAY
ncbi:hypothetical protein [Mixta calida]|uniref:hypothetical protein n=1 Tax=Mixta calida TaxID=665913 RepID=UPI00403B0AF3